MKHIIKLKEYIFSFIKNQSKVLQELGLLKAVASLFIGGLSKKYERTWGETLRIFIPFLFIFFIADYKYFTLSTPPLSLDGSFWLNLAYQQVYCGEFSHRSMQSIYEHKTVDFNKPVNKIYKVNCASDSKFIVMNETSLSNISIFFFKLFPSITLKQLSDYMFYLQIFGILLFAFFLLKSGLSPVFILFISSYAHFLIYLLNFGYNFAMYPFLIPNYCLLLSFSALYLYGLQRYGTTFIPFGFLVGLFAGFYCNFRTSHAPLALYTILLLTFLTYLLFKEKQDLKIKNYIFSFLCFAMLYLGIRIHDKIFLDPIHQEARHHDSYNYTYHAIAHPLVLALGGHPNSDLVKREGIYWSDAIGPTLAQKIDPSVKNLGASYEKAMFVYYLKLWIYYPKEMLDIYKFKFESLNIMHLPLPYFLKDYLNLNYLPYEVRKDFLENNPPYFTHPILKSLAYFIYWVKFPKQILIILIMSLALIGIFHKKFSTVGLFFALSIIGGCCFLVFESVAIMAIITLKYHALAIFLYAVLILFYVQIAITFLYNKIVDIFHLNKNYNPHIQKS